MTEVGPVAYPPEWSSADPVDFWSAVWDHFGIVGDPGERGEPGAVRFADARLNIAENLLRPLPGVDPVDSAAIIATAEAGGGTAIVHEVPRAELAERVAAVAAGLRERGLGPGDHVGIVLPVGIEALVLTLASLSIGAVVASAYPDLDADALVDRLGPLDPVVLAGTTSYRRDGTRHDRSEVLVEAVRRLPSVRALVVVPGSDDVSSPIDPDVTDDRRIAALAVAGSPRLLRVDLLGEIERAHEGAEPDYERLPFDHPAYVDITHVDIAHVEVRDRVHGAGGALLAHLVEIGTLADVGAGDRLLWATTTGEAAWRGQVSTLALGATLVLHDGAPTFPDAVALPRLAASTRATHLGIGADILEGLRAAGVPLSTAGDLSALRRILAADSPGSEVTARWIAADLGPDVVLQSAPGGVALANLEIPRT